MDAAVWAEAFWATLHGIVALNLTCPVFPTAPLDTVVGVALDAWLGVPQATQQVVAQQATGRTVKSRSVASDAGSRKRKPVAAQAVQAEASVEPESDPSPQPPSAT